MPQQYLCSRLAAGVALCGTGACALLVLGCAPAADVVVAASGPGQLRVINLVGEGVEVKIDGIAYGHTMTAGSATAFVPLKAGKHKVQVDQAGTSKFSSSVDLVAQELKSLVVVETGGEVKDYYVSSETRTKPADGTSLDIFYAGTGDAVDVTAAGTATPVQPGKQVHVSTTGSSTDLEVKSGAKRLPISGSLKANASYSLILTASKAYVVQNSGNPPKMSGAAGGG